MSLPRVVIAAPGTGAGKTTIATGLMAALRHAGHEVSGHKVGPDYIDPGYHALATGRPGRNLDPHLVGTERIVPLLLHGAEGADVAIVEGVMGLYDGRLGTGGHASTAHVAALTASPVVLVLDVARTSRTIAAVAAGMAAFDERIDIAGVLLNRTGSPRNDAEIVSALEQTGLPVLGSLPRDERLASPSRHLGLVPAAERDDSTALVQRLGEQVAEHVNLDALLALARRAPDLDAAPWEASTQVRPVSARPRVAVAGGRAFTLRYPETEELLRAAGCELVEFDPATDTGLPHDVQGLYLGGGFPETYAAELAANRALLQDVRAAIRAGLPTVAECAGLLYLARTLDGSAMAGAVAADAVMTDRLTLRYPVATAPSDSLLTKAGEQVTGHEFHRTRTGPPHGEQAAWDINGSPTGFASDSVHASYLHVHWAGYPWLAQRFADAVAATAPHRSLAGPSAAGRLGPSARQVEPLDDPLRHHGDAEVGAGLLDFAVNVHAGPRPPWLEHALHDSLREVGRYPTAETARVRIADRHDRPPQDVLPTAGAAEAFGLIARLRPWRRPVVIHPQFTEPHAALERAGYDVETVLGRPEHGFAIRAEQVPSDADLVILGNPTNPTGVLHPARLVADLRRRGRLVIVDEAFMDTVPGEAESVVAQRWTGIAVLRSLTKQWSIPGIRAGYVVGDPRVISNLEQLQTPWSVSTPAAAAMVACSTAMARTESRDRALSVVRWRAVLEDGLRARDIPFVPSAASFVLARIGRDAYAGLRDRGVAVRRGDTFPGLDPTWVRIAVRPPATTGRLLVALDEVRLSRPPL